MKFAVLFLQHEVRHGEKRFYKAGASGLANLDNMVRNEGPGASPERPREILQLAPKTTLGALLGTGLVPRLGASSLRTILLLSP